MTTEGDRVAGFGRLEDGLRQSSPWYTVGAVCQRAAVGHGPRGLQPGRRRVELPAVRPRQVARLPVGRGRAGRVQRHPPAALPRAGAVERARPVPQGAAVRADRAGGQPRRGRQGALVVPGRAAQPRLEPVALPLPAGGVPLRAAPAENARRDRRSPEYEILDTGVFDHDRYWITEVTYAKATTRHDLLIEITATNAGEDADTLHVLPTAWFRNTWSWENGAPKPVMRLGGERGGRHRAPLPRPARAARRHRRRRHRRQQRRPDAAVLRERDQRAAAVRLPAGHAVPQGRHQRPRGQRRRRP